MISEAMSVEAQGLCRRYGRRWALVDVSLELSSGSVTMLAGRNGSGKSTLLRILSTAIRADLGRGRIEGHDLRDVARVRPHVALVTHRLHLYEALTALENLQVAARFLGRGASRGELLPLLEEVGLAERADDPPAAFSAGMRKRLALARVLLQSASVVFLDEPYGQLDPPGFRMVDRFLAALRQRGATVLVATHLLEHAAPLCDQAIVLDAGRRIWAGPASEATALDLVAPSEEGG